MWKFAFQHLEIWRGEGYYFVPQSQWKQVVGTEAELYQLVQGWSWFLPWLESKGNFGRWLFSKWGSGFCYIPPCSERYHILATTETLGSSRLTFALQLPPRKSNIYCWWVLPGLTFAVNYRSRVGFPGESTGARIKPLRLCLESMR